MQKFAAITIYSIMVYVFLKYGVKKLKWYAMSPIANYNLGSIYLNDRNNYWLSSINLNYSTTMGFAESLPVLASTM